MEEDLEVATQLRQELENKTKLAEKPRRSSSSSSSSGFLALTNHQGGTPTEQAAEARRMYGTPINTNNDLNYWYDAPLGYLADQVAARGWRLKGHFYTQRS
eukprot:11660609-Heterocapsa_arctica.AAC.1